MPGRILQGDRVDLWQIAPPFREVLMHRLACHGLAQIVDGGDPVCLDLGYDRGQNQICRLHGSGGLFCQHDAQTCLAFLGLAQGFSPGVPDGEQRGGKNEQNQADEDGAQYRQSRPRHPWYRTIHRVWSWSNASRAD